MLVLEGLVGLHRTVQLLLFISLLFTDICKASSASKRLYLFALLFLGDGLDHCLLYNVMNLIP